MRWLIVFLLGSVVPTPDAGLEAGLDASADAPHFDVAVEAEAGVCAQPADGLFADCERAACAGGTQCSSGTYGGKTRYYCTMACSAPSDCERPELAPCSAPVTCDMGYCHIGCEKEKCPEPMVCLPIQDGPSSSACASDQGASL